MDRTLTMPRTIIGCDLSRAVLDLYSLPDAASTQVVNDPDDRRLWGGGRKIREALYIAVLTASRRVPSFVTMRDRMRERGKAPKTILIAVARRLLVIINAMLRNGTPLAACANNTVAR